MREMSDSPLQSGVGSPASVPTINSANRVPPENRYSRQPEVDAPAQDINREATTSYPMKPKPNGSA